jgi:MazG family protein
MHRTEAAKALQRLLNIMTRLREPDGCPWDIEQTPETLKPFLLEECYETLEAIDSGQPEKVCEELGDLLLQIVFQARIYEERGDFSMGEVITGIADKLERRHPHVFGDSECQTAADVSEQWEAIKKREKGPQLRTETTLGSIPPGLPALMHARKLTERASRAGFDWPEAEGALAKVREEMTELEQALKNDDQQAIEDELGDLLFAAANLGRYLKIDAEEALRKTVGRFIFRFSHVEKSLEKCGRSLRQASLVEMENLWQEAKDLTKN